jgi:hypothetical protein
MEKYTPCSQRGPESREGRDQQGTCGTTKTRAPCQLNDRPDPAQRTTICPVTAYAQVIFVPHKLCSEQL